MISIGHAGVRGACMGQFLPSAPASPTPPRPVAGYGMVTYDGGVCSGAAVVGGG
jgi:hypothetical protein